MKKTPTMVCASCAVTGDLGWCGRCRSIAYCCKECMDSDAARHLPECKQRRSVMLAKLARAKEHKRRMIEAAGCRAEDASKAVGTLCLICQETMESEAVIVPLTCGHSFHSACLRALRAKAEEEKVKPLCPACRLELHVSPDALHERGYRLITRAETITDAPQLQLKFVERAEAFLRLALREEPEHAGAHGQLGYLLMRQRWSSREGS